MNEQTDLFAARQARDEGIARVIAKGPTWHEQALDILRWVREWEGIAEDFRPLIFSYLGDPHSPHCWGALTIAAVKRGYLIPTGEYRQPKTVKSHARKTQVFRSVR